MAETISVTVGSVTASLDIPNTGQVNAATAYDVMYQTALDEYQLEAIFQHDAAELAALSALLLAIKAARAAALPALTLTPE
ncbi:hypothetical protein ACFLWA_12680 [Chloroflexota bacterium]